MRVVTCLPWLAAGALLGGEVAAVGGSVSTVLVAVMIRKYSGLSSHIHSRAGGMAAHIPIYWWAGPPI